MRTLTVAAATVAALGLTLAGCAADKAETERVQEQERIELTAGQEIDCVGDLDEAERVVCADGELRALDRRVAELWVQARAVTGRPATLERRHAVWLADRERGRRDWDLARDVPRTADELRDFYEDYALALEEELRQGRALPAQALIESLAGGCIGAALNGCSAPSAGFVAGSGGQRLAWQIQRGSSEAAGGSGGLVLFSVDGQTLRPIGWTFEGVSFEAPVIFDWNGRTYVAARGVRAGTGSANADVLYRLDGDRWTEIETESWKTALDERLPEGLGVWKGVDYRWAEMTAWSRLWRESDANCCPSGGDVVARLEVQGTALTLVGLETAPAEP